MRTVFCNDCHLSDDIPKLVADELLGVQQLDRLKARYKQMRKCYDFSYAEWQKEFSNDLKPFNGHTDTTSVCIPILNPLFRKDFEDKGAIGLDLPIWFNVQVDNIRIALIAQDPLHDARWYEECHDAIVSSPFGLHDATHRKNGSGGKMADLLINGLIKKRFAIYLTDANKYFVHDREASKK